MIELFGEWNFATSPVVALLELVIIYLFFSRLAKPRIPEWELLLLGLTVLVVQPMLVAELSHMGLSVWKASGACVSVSCRCSGGGDMAGQRHSPGAGDHVRAHDDAGGQHGPVRGHSSGGVGVPAGVGAETDCLGPAPKGRAAPDGAVLL